MKKIKLLMVLFCMAFLLASCGQQNSVEKEDNSVTVKTSPDKYTWYIKDYTGKNLASFGYTSLGGDRMDEYGSGYLELIFVNEDGKYIDISNDEDLKKYVVKDQDIEPNSELKFTFEKDENGEEYDNLVEYQNYQEIVLSVKETGSFGKNQKLTKINKSSDKYTWYVKNYVGRNLAFCGYESMGGDYRDRYGEGNVKLILISDDGIYIDPKDEESIKKYVVTKQNIAPNTEIKLEFSKDSNGKEYSNLVDNQNINEIELYVTPVKK